MGSAGLLLPAPPSMVSLASVQRLSDELPNITFAFASEVGYKVKSSLVRFSYPSMHLPETAPMAYGTGSHGPCISHRDEYMRDMAVINMRLLVMLLTPHPSCSSHIDVLLMLLLMTILC